VVPHGRLIYEGGEAAAMEEEENEDNFTYWDGLVSVFSLSLPIICSNLFHPSYMMVNAIVLGKIQVDKTKCPDPTDRSNWECLDAQDYVAAFGIASSSIGILILSTGFCYANGLMNIIPAAFSSGHYELCGAYLNRMLILSMGIFIPVILLMQFIYYPFLAITGDEKIATLATSYVRIMSISMPFYVGSAALLSIAVSIS